MEDEYDIYKKFLDIHSDNYTTYFPIPEGFQKWCALRATKSTITIEKLLGN